MYLKTLSIEGYKNFRDPFGIEFSKGLNVLVGENGAGKSAIVDALRLLLLEDEFGRNLTSEADFHTPFDKPKEPVEFFQIHGVFDDLSAEESVAFLPWTDENERATLTLYVQNMMTPRGRFKWELWGGVSRSSMFEKELFDSIHCVYLPPLRDAEAKLREGRGSRLARLLRNLNKKALKTAETNKDFHPLEREVKSFNEKLTEHESITYANDLIRKRLEEALGTVFGQDARIQYSETSFSRIVENLRLLFYPDPKQAPTAEMYRNLDQNSLGYNNLLYLATVLAELTEDGADDPKYLRLLLIEEPEAHLHPQLQIKLLKYLENKAEEERVQIIVTTHSPVLASAVSINSLVHLSGAPKKPFVAVSINKCALIERSADFLSRWLDATKSVLLFAKGVILVEGIAEAMLLPELAKRVLEDYNNSRAMGDKLPGSLEEAGVSVINMNGIYFRHFFQLFCDINGQDVRERIPVRCAGITDNDQGNNPCLDLIPTINQSRWVRLYSGKFKTLEFDLALEGANRKQMLEILIALWPADRTVKKALTLLLAMAEQDDAKKKMRIAAAILKRIEDTKIGKGVFAQALADRLSQSKAPFTVPAYISNAVIWATGGNV